MNNIFHFHDYVYDFDEGNFTVRLLCSGNYYLDSHYLELMEIHTNEPRQPIMDLMFGGEALINKIAASIEDGVRVDAASRSIDWAVDHDREVS